jgi:hypothetical protein
VEQVRAGVPSDGGGWERKEYEMGWVLGTEGDTWEELDVLNAETNWLAICLALLVTEDGFVAGGAFAIETGFATAAAGFDLVEGFVLQRRFR